MIGTELKTLHNFYVNVYNQPDILCLNMANDCGFIKVRFYLDVFIMECFANIFMKVPQWISLCLFITSLIICHQHN